MLLQKTGWRIKQLMSHRKNRTTADDEELPQSEKVRKRQYKTQSWISQTRLSSEASTLRRTVSSITARNVLSPSAPKIVKPSASSPCSCSCESSAMVASTPHSLFKHASLPPTSEILYLDPDNSPPSGDASTWKLIFSETTSQKKSTSIYSAKSSRLSPSSGGLTIDIIEALSLEPADGDKTPTQETPIMRPVMNENWSEDIERLIRETDEAFKMVGFALAEVKVATLSQYSDDNRPTKRNPPSRAVLRKQHKAPIARKASVSKPKRKRSDKKKARHERPSETALKPPRPLLTPSPRWTITEMTENMADIFTGEIFNRVEVDELLTPSRIRELQVESKIEIGRQPSTETTRSVSSDGNKTPVEPFHLDDLPSRLGAAGVLTPRHDSLEPGAGSRELPVPPIPDKSKLRKIKPKILDVRQSTKTSTFQFQDLTFPAPPQLYQSSQFSRRDQLLPTIPEISSQGWRGIGNGPGNGTRVRLNKIKSPITISKPGIVLQSTPYSLTSPPFRHGSIRLNREQESTGCGTDIGCDFGKIPSKDMALATERNGMLTGKVPGNNALDWTAFQMAISGGASDYLMDGDVGTCMEQLEQDVEDIVEWWAGFGFAPSQVGVGGLGELLCHDPLVKKMTKTKKGIGKREEVNVADEKQVSDSFMVLIHENEARKPVGTKQRPVSGDESDCSLPDSPMEDINPGMLLKESELVPMGFNLGHDLGDFLKWETEHIDLVGWRENSDS